MFPSELSLFRSRLFVKKPLQTRQFEIAKTVFSLRPRIIKIMLTGLVLELDKCNVP